MGIERVRRAKETVQGLIEMLHGEIIDLSKNLSITTEPLGAVAIHLTTDPHAKIDTGKKLLSRDEAMKGLHKLAGMLEHDRRLSETKEILLYSWIVTEHPELCRMLGFSLDDGTHPLTERLNRMYMLEKKYSNLKDTKPSLAKMKREEFLQRYGS